MTSCNICPRLPPVIAVPAPTIIVPPSVVIVAPNAHNLTDFDVDFDWNVPVIGFDVTDVVVVGFGTTLSPFVGGPQFFTTTVTPGATDITLSVPAAVCVDGVGTPNVANPGVTIPIDITRPTTTVTGPATYSGTTPFDITITFSEDVTGFEIGDINQTASDKSNFMGGPAVYTCTLTPNSPPVNILVNIPADVAFDGAGNGNLTSNVLFVNHV